MHKSQCKPLYLDFILTLCGQLGSKIFSYMVHTLEDLTSMEVDGDWGWANAYFLFGPSPSLTLQPKHNYGKTVKC